MSIHHRCGSRYHLVLDVEIKHHGKNLGATCTRNVNPYGVFIDFPSDELTTDDFVEMYFVDNNKNNATLIQKGLVTHHSAEGIGVLFAYDKEEFRIMLQNKLAQQKVTIVI